MMQDAGCEMQDILHPASCVSRIQIHYTMLKRLLVLLIPIVLAVPSSAQVNLRDTTIGMAMFYATYSYQFPGGDLAKMFGSNSSIGGGFQYKFRSNWIIGAEGNYLFGSTVKIADTLLKMISTSLSLIHI